MLATPGLTEISERVVVEISAVQEKSAGDSHVGVVEVVPQGVAMEELGYCHG